MNSKIIERIGLFVILFIFFFSVANIWVARKFEVEGFPLEKNLAFDDYIRTDYRDEISQKTPGIVVVGDSAIRQLYPDVFTRELGTKTFVHSAPGSASAYWYLFLRNAILPSDSQPQLFIIFFRNTTLTTPGFLVHGSYFNKLDEIAHPNDADVYGKAIQSRKSVVLNLLEKILPIFAYRSEIYSNFTTNVRNYLPELALDCGPDCVDEAFEYVFDDRQINALLWEEYLLNLDETLYEPENLKFENQVNKSFLPEIINDSRSNGMVPVFVRVRYKSHAQGQSDPPELIVYLNDLKEYIEKHGGLYIDLVEENGLTQEMYRDNIHINEDYAETATTIIARVIREKIESILVD